MLSKLPLGLEQIISNELGEEGNCPFCHSRDLHFEIEKGELICRSCGSVLEERLAIWQTRRTYGPEEEKERMHHGIFDPFKKNTYFKPYENTKCKNL